MTRRFIIVRACSKSLSSRFTSGTEVPLPAAIRRRRLPSIVRGSRRSRGVMLSRIASYRLSFPSSGAICSRICRFIPGSMAMISSTEPIFFT